METGALDAYLLWEYSKTVVHEALACSPIDLKRISGSITLAKESVAGPTVEAKMEIVGSQFPVRADRLRKKRWALEEYPVSRLGTVLPWMGDLPLEEIVKSFLEVANFVRRATEGESGLKSVRYIRSLSGIADILDTIPVMVIEPGSEQRRPDVLRERGREDLFIFPAEGYIEDGNHRALALMFSNPHRSSIGCWVGR